MGELSRKKALLIIASHNFRDEELDEPRNILEQKGASVTLASSTLTECSGMLGATAKPDILVDDVDVSDYDAVLFIGGLGASEYFDNPTAHAIAKKATESNKVLGAICIAPSTLANAGLLGGRKATCYSAEIAENLKAKGARFTGNDVETDGNIVTANGPDAANAFGREVADKLAR